MTLIRRVLFLTGTFCLPAILGASAQTAFAPFEEWRAAAVAGNTEALAKFYSTDPPANVLVGRKPVGGADNDLQFWSGLKSSGMTGLNPKVLAVASQPDQKRLVLRVQAVKPDGHAVAASVRQIWVQQATGWHIAVTQRSEFYDDPGRRLPEPAKPNTSLYPPPEAAAPELDTALAEAGREHKRVLVVFGANWCYDCHVLDTTFHSKDFALFVEANYVVLHVNIGDEGKDNQDLASKLGVALDKGIPSLAVLSPDRQVVVAQRQGEFEDTEKIGPEEVRAFLEKWKPSVQASR